MLADIAAKVGVSNVAVSKALSGKPGVSWIVWVIAGVLYPAVAAIMNAFKGKR